MNTSVSIHQIMPGFLYGDALGNQAAYIRDLLRSWGYVSQVYAQYRDRRLRDPGKDYWRYPGTPDNLVIFNYSIGSPVTEFVAQLPDHVVPYYHNVTPAGFLRGYKYESIEGTGTETYNIDKGLLEHYTHRYSLKAEASMLMPLGPNPKVAINQTLTAKRVGL